jgi:hypothetical protein
LRILASPGIAPPPLTLKQRLEIVSILVILYGLSALLGVVTLPGHLSATGLRDMGHFYIPSLMSLVGSHAAEYVLWLGTLPLELFFLAILVVIVVSGRGARLGACLYVMYLLHWLCLHATTLPPPDAIVWRFPAGVFTFGRPAASDFWFSGHVANAFVIALAAARSRTWVKALAWSLFAFEVLLVLSARTHYSIDVIGALFVGYSIHRLSLDVAGRFRSRLGLPLLS